MSVLETSIYKKKKKNSFSTFILRVVKKWNHSLNIFYQGCFIVSYLSLFYITFKKLICVVLYNLNVLLLDLFVSEITLITFAMLISSDMKQSVKFWLLFF